MVDLEEILESPGFWILAGGGVACEIIGWIASKRMMEYSFPIWQLLIMIIVTIIAAGFFAGRE